MSDDSFKRLITWLSKIVLYIIVIPIFFISCLLSFLPWALQLKLLKPFSYLLVLTKRGKIVRKNLSIAFPDESEQQRRQWMFENFQNTLAMVLASFNAWHSPSKLLKKAKKVSGLEHILNANKAGQGCVLMTGHFTAVHIANTALFEHFDFSIVYRKSENPLLDYFLKTNRKGNKSSMIDKSQFRKMLSLVRKGGNLGYASDQKYGGSAKGMVDFFNHKVSALVSLHQFVKLGKAKLCPVSFFYHDGGYEVEIHPPFENSEGMSPLELTQQYMSFIEQQIKKHPAQYYWVHKRFDRSFYKNL